MFNITKDRQIKDMWSSGWPQTPEEFEALTNHVLDRLVWYASRMLMSVDDAEDVVQEVLVRVYAERDKRSSVQRVVPYLYRMVLNACLERRRRNAKKPTIVNTTWLEDIPEEPEHVAQIEGVQWIEQLLSQLPSKQAEIIRLKVINDMPLSEVALNCGCSLSTAKSRLAYGLRKLRHTVAFLASSTLAQAAQYVEGAKTMHISARMRTIPSDSFDSIDLNAPLIPIEIWKQFDPLKIRLEKEGRKIAYDGQNTTMLVQSCDGVFVFKFDGLPEGLFSTLKPLLHTETLFESERKVAEHSNSIVRVTTEVGADDRKKTILTISANAQGDFSESNHRKNTSIIESDNIRIYTFDTETSRCEGMQVYIRTERGNVLVFETANIQYNAPLKLSLFKLRIPKSAVLIKPTGSEPTADTSSMEPDEVARVFFEALNRSDWEAVRQFASTWFDNTKLRETYGGLEVISIGKPFKSGMYYGWFVPYEIRLKSGKVKKFNLAARNDTPNNQWIWDGGL